MAGQTIVEEGTVLSLESGLAKVAVESHKKEACKSCGACMPLVKGGPLVLEAKPFPGIEPGNRVAVEVSLSASFWSSFFQLLLLLAAFLGGALLGAWLASALHPSGSLTGLFAFLGGILLAGIACLFLYAGNRAWNRKNRPRIIRKLG